MSEGKAIQRPVPSEPSPTNGQAKKKPERVLPTKRIATAKQFDILRAFGAASGPDGSSVTNVEVSKIVDLHAATVGLITPFFVDIGLLQKLPDGFRPADEVAGYTAAFEWNSETAFHRVAPILRGSWFFRVLQPRLRFRPLPKDAALQELAVSANAAPEFRGQLEGLLEYLESAGLIAEENGHIRLLNSNSDADAEDRAAAPRVDSAPQSAPPAPIEQHRQAPMLTSFANPTAGVVQFNISVKVDMAEFAGWSPERISSFFSGVAQVLAAKGQMEKQVAEP